MSITNGNSIYNGAGVLKSRSVYKGLYKEGGLVLPPYTLRFKANRAVSLSDFRSTLPITLTLVDGAKHIYDVKLERDDWSNLFFVESENNDWIVEVLAANTSGVTNMFYMLYNCTSLVSVPLFDTSKVTNMNSMLRSCSSLVSVPLFDTSKVTNMSYMLRSCSSLVSVPLFDTSKVTDFSYMLRDCTLLKSVPLFDTSSATDMTSVLYGCNKVESGALALYTQASTQAIPPTSHSYAFTSCGADTATGLAELQQIPSDWGGRLGVIAKGIGNDSGIIFDDGSGTETDTNENF